MSLNTVGIRGGDGTLAQNKQDFWNEGQDISPALAREIEEYEQSQRHFTTKTGTETKEELARLHEENEMARRAFRWPKQEELAAKRVGRILNSNGFIYRLQMIANEGKYLKKAWLTDKGSPGMLGLFVVHGSANRTTCTHEPDQPHYVCAVQAPFMQEFEELHFDAYNVPLGSKRRGWRTVLLKLFEQGIITPQQADAVFGEAPSGLASRRYREYVQYLRGRGLGL